MDTLDTLVNEMAENVKVPVEFVENALEKHKQAIIDGGVADTQAELDFVQSVLRVMRYATTPSGKELPEDIEAYKSWCRAYAEDFVDRVIEATR